MHAALAIAAKDLRQRVRDRSAIVVAVIAPFALAAVFSVLMPSGRNEFTARYRACSRPPRTPAWR